MREALLKLGLGDVPWLGSHVIALRQWHPSKEGVKHAHVNGFKISERTNGEVPEVELSVIIKVL